MTLGRAVTLWTVRAACVLYGAAVASWLLRRPAIGRAAWSLGCLLFVLHVAGAFESYHGWSHSAAYRETARQTAEIFGLDWGGGLYLNYAFAIVWVIDVAWMWARPESYLLRPARISAAVHAFMTFMFFNATVVFGSTRMRWAGVVGFAMLFYLLARQLRTRSGIGFEIPKDELHPGEKKPS
jgi:hypothetical protein